MKFIKGFFIGVALLLALAIVVGAAIGLIVVAEHFIGALAIPVVLGVGFCTAIGIVFATDGE